MSGLALPKREVTNFTQRLISDRSATSYWLIRRDTEIEKRKRKVTSPYLSLITVEKQEIVDQARRVSHSPSRRARGGTFWCLDQNVYVPVRYYSVATVLSL